MRMILAPIARDIDGDPTLYLQHRNRLQLWLQDRYADQFLDSTVRIVIGMTLWLELRVVCRTCS